MDLAMGRVLGDKGRPSPLPPVTDRLRDRPDGHWEG